MDPHHIQLPREIIIGEDAFDNIPGILEKLKLKGPGLMLSGPTTYDIAGADVKNVLQKYGFEIDTRIIEETNKKTVEETVKAAADYGFIIGVGGGRIIDVAKYTGSKSDNHYISVPTAPSHDGITSSRVSIDQINDKHSKNATSPSGIFINTNIISSSPNELISAGCGDLISNITAVEDWKLANSDCNEYYSDYAAALSVLSAEIVIKSAKMIKNRERRGIRNLIKALLSAGIAMSIAGSSRPCSGAEHQFSHSLDALYDKNEHHGNQCSMGALISAYLHGMDWEKLKKAMEELAIPTHISQVAYTKEEIIKAWRYAPQIRDRYTILDKRTENNINIEKILDKVGII